MALERDFLAMASTTVDVAPLSTVGDYGEPTYGASVTYTARVEHRTRLVVDTDGNEVRSGATVFVMSSSASITVNDKLTMSDGRTPRLLAVEPIHDDEGQHHVEIAVR